MNRLRRLFQRRQIVKDLTNEMNAHIEEKMEELVESGMRPEEARRKVKLQFGNTSVLREKSLEVWSFSAIEAAWRDLRIAARGLRRNPLFSAICATTLALGIGANVAIFSLIQAVLLRPLPFPNADRIAMLWEVSPNEKSSSVLSVRHGQNLVSPVNYLDWRDRTHSFAAMAAIAPFPAGLSGFGEPRQIDSVGVSADFFHVLGIQPLLGRVFTRGEDVPNGPRLAVLSYGLWLQQFGGDRSVLGRNVQLNDESYTILGVMPESFNLPFAHADIWLPAQIARSAKPNEGRFMTVIAKRKAGVSKAQAAADLANVARQIARERPLLSLGWTTNIVSLYDQITGDVKTALLLLYGVVTFVLLIAAVNVANLLLMRGTQRRRELAVCAALGASRTRLMSQMLAESLLLSLAGGALGIGLASFALLEMAHSLPALGLPNVEAVHLNGTLLGFSILVCLVTTILFGLAPALSFSRANTEETLKQSNLRTTGRGVRRLRSLLVVLEMTLSLVLLVGAGLVGRSFLNQINEQRGFRTDHILTMQMFFGTARYENNNKRSRYLSDILDRVRAIPGVEAASSAHFLPMTGMVSGSGFTRADRPTPAPGTQPEADFLVVSPQYFSVMGIPLLAGRDFASQDTLGKEPAVIVNEAFAKRFFPGEDPLGKKLNLDWNIPDGVIIGVTASARQTDLTVPPNPTIFLDNVQSPFYFAGLVIRTALPPQSIAHAAETAIHAVDPDQAVSHVQSMDQLVSASVARPRLESALLGGFAVIALTLASIGLYGVLAYLVTQRTREIGIRMALGANPGRVVREVMRDGFRLLLSGIAAGLIASLFLTRLLGSLLYGVKPADPATFSLVAVTLLAIGLIACLLPARHAAAVDPVSSLRWE
ncbi:MAG TPA: ABC transporter permease [Bryobacteraceae bacterium]|nr:ABC transporter permease [Bryobacteraceae bacterium]